MEKIVIHCKTVKWNQAVIHSWDVEVDDEKDWAVGQETFFNLLECTLSRVSSSVHNL